MIELNFILGLCRYMTELNSIHDDADMIYLRLCCMDAKVCGQNQRAFGIMDWDQSPRTGKEHATKAKTISSTATGNPTN